MEDSFYAHCYDKTTNVSGHKELHTTMRYWSNKQRVINCHLQTYFMGKAKGNSIYQKIKNGVDNSDLPVSKLLMHGSDAVSYTHLDVYKRQI